MSALPFDPPTLGADVALRTYEASDWPAICLVHDRARVFELTASGLMEAFLTLEQAAENEGLFDSQIIVAERHGQIAGFVGFTSDELTWLYVDPAAMRHGIGRALLRAAVQACPDGISTEVLVGNDAALTLYLSEGFVIEERVDGKLAGNEGFAASGYVLRYAAAGKQDRSMLADQG
jgi:ribosomal protein S18 acetylase RimI-like enzyme